ncbi:DivIVA domain-containing protein [Nocardioides sp. TF02-7]|uniref:DivIVA domain-containing protein n=1 Tax=Nocardioides sp. TF02-7 TaxID=2917724 RepID=UPI001F05428A|nr:DivIVA domain-containing protein [Nocardioides sp. TF02-7]UMG91765.1 DivIVA domain-containing protein [Nocardioides sp. TF02-7]
MSQSMMWVFAVLVVLAMGGIALLAAGKGEPMHPAYDDRPDAAVPADRPLGGDDLRRVRFSLAFRGYRMSEVDALLARVAAELEQRSPGVTPGARPEAGPEAGPAAAPGTTPDTAPDTVQDTAPDTAQDTAPDRNAPGSHVPGDGP